MSSLFRPALPLLTQYAAYHRDRRNIATHFVGIPMIVFAICVLLGRPVANLGGWPFAPLHAVLALSTLWYLSRGAGRIGLATAAVNALLAVLAQPLAQLPTAAWLGWGVGLFAVGWVFQFVGHAYEGRKPAFVDDLVGLLVGPMFVVAEALFALGQCRDVQAAIEAEVGPTRGAPAPSAASGR